MPPKADISELNNKYETLLKQVEALSKTVVEQTSTIIALTNRIQQLEENPAASSPTTDAWSVVVGKKLNKTPAQLDMLNCVANENKDRMKRDKNLIVFGIPSSTKSEPNEKQLDDEKKIKELLTKVKINSENVVKCFRLRSKDPNKPPPIIVETTDTVTRNNIIKAARRKFEGIYVNPDLTEAQRRQDRQLRDELKNKNEPLDLKNNWATAGHYYVIRNNTVVKVEK